jgi:DNA-binding NtrC family response regulator
MDLRQRWVGAFTLEMLSSSVPAMQRLARQVRLARSVRVPVLLVGERGTGKETIARIIHYQGPDRERSFAALDCRRLPGAVLASILFGDERGRKPLLGAIYLDELACLARDVQSRLAQELSNTSAAPVDDAVLSPRLLAGTSRRPEEDIRAGRLLEELYGLLSPLTVEVPALRERRDDLPRLVAGWLPALDTEERSVAGLTPAAWEVVRRYAWPGNLSELRQVLADAHRRTTSGRIDAGDLPAALRLEQGQGRATGRPVPLQQTLEEVERRLIRLALRRARGNRSRAAELLGIYRPRLLRRMEALEMEEAKGTVEEAEE